MTKVVLVIFIFLNAALYAEFIHFDTKEMTKHHNKLRKHYNSPALVYSKKLEDAAKKWVSVLQKDGCRMVHSHGKVGNYGENIFWASPLTRIQTDSKGKSKRSSKIQTITPTQVSQAWYNEVEFYNYETNSCKKGEMCGHYTQVIWDTTKEIGCAALSCDDKSQVWVCEYFPAGNISMRYSDGRVKKLKPYQKNKN